jgi:hypothetical protein
MLHGRHVLQPHLYLIIAAQFLVTNSESCVLSAKLFPVVAVVAVVLNLEYEAQVTLKRLN